MIHPQYLVEGREIKLPELSTHLPNTDDRFIIRAVHAGGMGMCVKLQQVATGQDYALKSVRPEYIGDKHSIERFFDELKVWLSASACSLVAEAIAIVSINESPCVLAPWMKGGDLSDAMAKMSLELKFEAIVRITRGLRWVQENLNVIHRDLKPANILLDESRQAYIADWGLARPMGHAFAANFPTVPEDAILRPDRTTVGSFVGTVLYAAPEQIRNLSSIDYRADIYALGCIIFELETGNPPFTGRTREEVAQKHLYMEPPKLSWSFMKKTMGLEYIVARCLKKDFTERWSSYAELDEALTGIAQKHRFPLNRCNPQKRYDRSVLGQGQAGHNKVLEGGVHGKGYGVVDFDEIKKYWEEASNLMALDRYDEAEKLMAPYHVDDFLNNVDLWHWAHTLSLNYAFCLTQLSGRLDEALGIYQRLNENRDKPAELYVNYALALLKAKKYTEARDICNEGLIAYPNDADLIGNRTIAFHFIGDLEGAKASALQRLRIRRDLHSLDEAVTVLGKMRDQERNNNLPGAIETAILQADLLYEGRQINPNYFVLITKEVDLHRFANNTGHAAQLCSMLLDSDCHQTIRGIAYFQVLDIFVETKLYEAFFEKFEPKIVDTLSNRDMLVTLYYKTIALTKMIGRDSKDGKRIIIPQTRDYFLQKAEDRYVYPVMAARVLDWIEHPQEAASTLYSLLQTEPNNLEAARAMSEILARNGNVETAILWAEYVVKLAPWKAESFDLSSYVHNQAGQKDIAQKYKTRGDEVFKQEKVLFEKLRQHLAAFTGK